jgi:hypothetical protein
MRRGEDPELINDSKFEDFKLPVEFNCGSNCNSGVYLRGRYEVAKKRHLAYRTIVITQAEQ